MEYIITFFTHSGAIKFERFVRTKAVEATLMPVPRKFSSNCGIAARIICSCDISELIIEDVEKIFLINGSDSKLVYTTEE